jgi:hypothetical protein
MFSKSGNSLPARCDDSGVGSSKKKREIITMKRIFLLILA